MANTRKAKLLPGFDAKFELGVRQVPDPFEPSKEIAVPCNLRADLLTALYEGSPRGGKPSIDRAQHRAGNRFSALLEAAQRQSSLTCDPTKEPIDGGRKTWEFTEKQATAWRELRRVHAELGASDYRLAYAIIGLGIPMYSLAKKTNRWQEKQIARRFRHILTRLAILWGYEGPYPQGVDNVRQTP